MTFRKSAAGAPADLFPTEAAGLAWLAETGTVPVVEVLAVSADALVLERLAAVLPTRDAAAEFGAALAALHRSPCPAHGTLPPGVEQYRFGPLSDPLPVATAVSTSMGEATAVRLADLVDRLPADSPVLRRVIDRLAAGDLDDDAPAARLHGDLWAGNLLFTASGGTLIDPAAIAGHPLVDLAMLSLFGAPHLDTVLGAWEDAYGTADIGADWRTRIGLHQLFGVTAHAVLFGGGYLASAEALAARYA